MNQVVEILATKFDSILDQVSWYYHASDRQAMIKRRLSVI